MTLTMAGHLPLDDLQKRADLVKQQIAELYALNMKFRRGARERPWAIVVPVLCRTAAFVCLQSTARAYVEIASDAMRWYSMETWVMGNS